MINWSEKFNALPDDVRRIGAGLEAHLRIQHLNFEKDRLKKNYERSLREINAHITNCKEWLKRLESEHNAATAEGSIP